MMNKYCGGAGWLATSCFLACMGTFFTWPAVAAGQDAAEQSAAGTFPPLLPGGRTSVTDRADVMLRAPATIDSDVAIASAPPTIDFLYFPGQDYPGNPWSNWGDGLAAGGKYYASIGDHLAISAEGDHEHGTGTALVFEYDPATKSFRKRIDVSNFLKMPKGHYTPGKIHGRLDLGRDGWLYFATHRGSTRATDDKYHFQGEWIIRVEPQSGRAEVVARGPVSKHAIPTSLLDPDRLIFYGGTVAGTGVGVAEGIHFFAYDCNNRKLLYSGPDGPAQAMIFAKSTGRVYYVAGEGAMIGPLWRYDPEVGGVPKKIGVELGLRAATEETPQGMVYTVSNGAEQNEAILYAFDTKSEKAEKLGPAAVGSAQYITSIDADPSGRYLYYVPGAHGSSPRDGSPVVQYDTRTKKRKVIAFLYPFYKDTYGATLVGTFSTAVDPAGDKLYITWNVSRGGRAWDCCALTVIHIPESERQP